MRFINKNSTLTEEHYRYLNMMVNLYMHDNVNTCYVYTSHSDPVYIAKSLLKEPVPDWLRVYDTHFPGVVELNICDIDIAFNSDEYARCRIIEQQEKVARMIEELTDMKKSVDVENKILNDMINSREQVK